MLHLINLINLIRVNIKHRQKFALCRLNTTVLKSLKILYELGYISGYTILNQKFGKIFFCYNRGRSVISDIRCVSKPGNPIYLKKKNLSKKLMLNSFFICSSSVRKNFVTDIEAVLLRTGGTILFNVT